MILASSQDYRKPKTPDLEPWQARGRLHRQIQGQSLSEQLGSMRMPQPPHTECHGLRPCQEWAPDTLWVPLDAALGSWVSLPCYHLGRELSTLPPLVCSEPLTQKLKQVPLIFWARSYVGVRAVVELGKQRVLEREADSVDHSPS